MIFKIMNIVYEENILKHKLQVKYAYNYNESI